MDRDISTWQRAVLHQDDQLEMGLATRLFEASKAAFTTLLRVLVAHSAQLDYDSSVYAVLRNEFQKFYMWNDGFSTSSGELDRILCYSKNLRATVLGLMVKWAKAVCRSNYAPSFTLLAFYLSGFVGHFCNSDNR
jgi:hypothetical protein